MTRCNKLLQNLTETPYQKVAKEFGVSAKYVGMIARGERKVQRGKGLSVKNRLEELIKSNHN